MKSKIILSGLIAGGVALLLLTGCASTKSTKQVLVCPECKIVLQEEFDPFSDTTDVRMVEKHSCPGCQGALVTLFKEGKLKHKCSICSQTPYSCPVYRHSTPVSQAE